MTEFAQHLGNVDDLVAGKRARAFFRPPPKLTLSEWADLNFYLSPESSAQAGRWTTLPYQKELLDTMTDPRVTHVSVMKSARVGFTKCLNALIGYHIHHAPCPILVVQPTIEDAKGFSKEEIAPMIRDCPALSAIVFKDSEETTGPVKDSTNTLLHKAYPGGLLSLVGANSGTGFRRISRKVVCLDEVDAYPPSSGVEGDPVKLATKRTEYYHDRKIVAGSTPLIAGHSRIEELFEAGDQRRYFVPCPTCGHFDILVFSERAEGGGHYMVFDPKAPEGAHFVCSANGCVIEHHHKRDMVARGEWRAAKPFAGHASFHIWAAYSFSPNATWGQIAAEFLEAKKLGRETLKTFCNTVLGECWKETGEAPEWERLYQRREHYQIGSVPDGVKFVTVGVDVQKDRWVYEVVGWAAGRKSWSIDAGVIPGKTENEAEWTRLDELLDRKYLTATGLPVQALMLAIDSGYQTQMVYWWARRHRNVIATKGVHTQHAIVGSPTPVDIRMNGGRIANGCKVWPVGASKAKEELYGWLRMQAPTDGSATPNGWCAFPEHGEDFFKQLCGEQLVSTTHKRTGVKVHEWQVIPGRENHWLDARIAARVAAAVLGLDRLAMPGQVAPAVAAPVVARPAPAPAAPAQPARTLTDSRFTGRRSGGWLSKR